MREIGEKYPNQIFYQKISSIEVKNNLHGLRENWEVV